jgi:hypothetical protein
VSPVAVVEHPGLATLPLWPADEPDLGPPAEMAAPSLEEAFATRWSALESGFTAACLLCGGVVHPRWSAGAGVVGGRCESCGTEID